jgi:hypothetical protein
MSAFRGEADINGANGVVKRILLLTSEHTGQLVALSRIDGT